MKQEVLALKIFHELGVHKLYKGCEYILSSIKFIRENEKNFSPVTKVLYVEIAKIHNTSSVCVERDMRNIIEAIWKQKENGELLSKIFGEYNVKKRPSNMEFLMLLYNYIRFHVDCDELLAKEEYTFMCPLSRKKCEYCNGFVIDAVSNILRKPVK